MSELFDNLSRILATQNSRRQTLRFIGSATTVVVMNSFTKRAVGQTNVCQPDWLICAGVCMGMEKGFDNCCVGPQGEIAATCPIDYKCCFSGTLSAQSCCPLTTNCCVAREADGFDAVDENGNPTPLFRNSCCQPGQLCNPEKQPTCVNICPSNQVKCGNTCCLPGETCDTVTLTCTPLTTCPPGQVKCGSTCCASGETCDTATLTCRPLTNAEKAQRIKDIAKKAAIKHYENCSGSVRQVAKELGIPFTEGNANTQIDWMQKNWQPLTMAQAKERADRGEFVVAGLKDRPNGHTTTVVTGSGVSREGVVWPNIAGGAKNNSLWPSLKTEFETSGATDWSQFIKAKRAVEATMQAEQRVEKQKLTWIVPSAYSEGDRTVRSGWGTKQLGEVEYYTPKQ